MSGSQEERTQVTALAREFADAELRPRAAARDAGREVGDEVWSQLAELGFFGMLVPEAWGGLGFDLGTYAAVLEELARGDAAVAYALAVHGAYGVGPLLRHGTPEQQAAWLEPLASGAERACFALTEERAGSDTAAIETRARRDGDGWVLEGEKTWVANGRHATVAIVAARTGDPSSQAASEGPPAALFLVPTNTPGYEIMGRRSTMGLRALEFASVRLRDVRVPGDALLGESNLGLEYVERAALEARIGVAAIAAGIAGAALEHAVAYGAVRQQFGRPLREFQGIQFMLADMAARVEAIRALVSRAADSPTPRSAAVAKLVGGEAAMWVTTKAVQIFGGYGYMRDYPVEKLMRDAKAMEICEGTSEMMRVLIARELYREAGA